MKLPTAGYTRVFREWGKSMKRWVPDRYSSRESLPASKKKAVRERVKRKYGRIVCEVCRKKPRWVTLEFHHKNMKNSDNKLDNLQLLCPNHHKQKHGKYKRKVYRDSLTGRQYYTRKVKRKPKKVKKRR